MKLPIIVKRNSYLCLSGTCGMESGRTVGVLPVQETTAEVLFHTVCSKVKELGIEISNLRGQCYDGVNMEAWHINASPCALNRDDGSHLPQEYLHLVGR